MSIERRIVRASVVVVAATTLCGVVVGFGTHVAWAQQGFGNSSPSDEVSVDMSVLGGGTAPMMPGYAPLPGVRGGLLMPGPQAPVSRLYVEAPVGRRTADPAMERPVLKRPEPTRAETAPEPMPSMAAVEAPKPRMTEPVPVKPMAEKPAVAATPEQPSPRVASVASPQPSTPAPSQDLAARIPAPPAPVKAPVAAAAQPAPQPRMTPESPAEPAPATSGAMTPPPPPPPPVATKLASAPTDAPKTAPKSAGAAGSVNEGDSLVIVFDEDSPKMPESAQADLKKLIGGFEEQADLRLRLFAYAGGPELSSSKARRLSLSRALDVRSFLMKQGVRSTRIDVRALGDRIEGDPANRVDIKVVKR